VNTTELRLASTVRKHCKVYFGGFESWTAVVQLEEVELREDEGRREANDEWSGWGIGGTECHGWQARLARTLAPPAPGDKRNSGKLNRIKPNQG